MTFTGSLSGLSVCEENSSEETSVSLSYVSGTVVGRTEVEAGKVYIIKIKLPHRRLSVTLLLRILL